METKFINFGKVSKFSFHMDSDEDCVMILQNNIHAYDMPEHWPNLCNKMWGCWWYGVLWCSYIHIETKFKIFTSVLCSVLCHHKFKFANILADLVPSVVVVLVCSQQLVTMVICHQVKFIRRSYGDYWQLAPSASLNFRCQSALGLACKNFP